MAVSMVDSKASLRADWKVVKMAENWVEMKAMMTADSEVGP